MVPEICALPAALPATRNILQLQQGDPARPRCRRAGCRCAESGLLSSTVPIVEADGDLELRAHRALRHRAVAHADTGGRYVGVAFERIEVLALRKRSR